MEAKPVVSIVMGSDSDWSLVVKAHDFLNEFDIAHEVRVISAHRSPDIACEYAATARERGIKVIIAAAGGAAHLAGVIAGHTTLPVIGIPVQGGALNGLDALLATVQMPSGIPVATVAVDGAVNAALLCIEILAVTDSALAEKLDQKRKADTANVLDKNAKIEKMFN